MTAYLIKCTGFIGDILFASSIAQKLHEEALAPLTVDYAIPLPQPKLLLEQNPWINRVIYDESVDESAYTHVITIPAIYQSYPATLQLQLHAGIKNPTLAFDVQIPVDYVREAEVNTSYIRRGFPPGTKLVAWQRNWEWKAYQTTDALLAQRKGGPHRDIESIISRLSMHPTLCLIPVGFDRHVNQTDAVALDPKLYAKTAAMIQQCDWMIGSEGGLTNLAASVGTKCIITTDFIWQNYGPQGLVRPTPYPMMGPAVYYPDAGHVHLHYEQTDDDIYHSILDTICG